MADFSISYWIFLPFEFCWNIKTLLQINIFREIEKCIIKFYLHFPRLYFKKISHLKVIPEYLNTIKYQIICRKYWTLRQIVEIDLVSTLYMQYTACLVPVLWSRHLVVGSSSQITWKFGKFSFFARKISSKGHIDLILCRWKSAQFLQVKNQLCKRGHSRLVLFSSTWKLSNFVWRFCL